MLPRIVGQQQGLTRDDDWPVRLPKVPPEARARQLGRAAARNATRGVQRGQRGERRVWQHSVGLQGTRSHAALAAARQWLGHRKHLLAQQILWSLTGILVLYCVFG